MASTYSPNLRIELIATGEQSNTWGVTTNSNLGTLIEQAISGVVSVSVTAGDVTLTALNGATDQSRQMVIIATGTPGVARVITAPAVGKVYVVHNNSDASLSFIASGGTGVTLIVGAKKYIYCDGTNFYEAINALTVTSGTINNTTIGATTATTGRFTTVQSTVATGTAPFIVASTTAVANLTASNVTTNANLTGAVTSVGNATSLGSFTSAQLATALTDETGSGAAVFATSPTLVTPALGTPSALVGTNITGTATAFTASNVTTNANLTGGVTSVGNAATVVTNANLTGAVTSVGNASSLGSFTSAQLATALTDETGTGANVFATSPTLVTPALGTPSALVGTNITGTATNFTASNVTTNANLTGGVTSVGNAATVVTNANLTGGVTSVGNAATVVTNANLTGAVTSVGNTSSLGSFTSANLAAALTDETGTGANVFAISPTLVTPNLGTPTTLVGTNITGTATAFTASNVTTNANLTGAVTSVGNGTSLGSFTSANLAGALTDETGSGSAVFGTSPTLTSPVISGTPSGVGVLTSDTAQATTSGTFKDFTGIPSWVKRVTLMFSGVSTNGTSVKQVQLNGEVSGYLGTAAALDGAPVASNYTTGAAIRSTTAANTINGLIVIQNLSGNIWVFSGMLGDGTGNQNYSLGFSKTTAAALTSIRLTTVNGTDTFDAGSINIMYE